MVILFGSRATGRQQEDSVVDLMVVTLPAYPPASRVGASRAARDYLEDDPPSLEVNVIQMPRRELDYCRSASQHIAGQTANHGTILNGDRLVEPPPREDGSPAHWVETQRCIQRAFQNNREFAAMVDRNYRSRKLTGFRWTTGRRTRPQRMALSLHGRAGFQAQSDRYLECHR